MKDSEENAENSGSGSPDDPTIRWSLGFNTSVTPPRRRSNVSSVSMATLGNIRKGSFSHIFSGINFRRNSEPNAGINGFQTQADSKSNYEAMQKMEAAQKLIMDDCSKACLRHVEALRDRVNAIKYDIGTIVKLGCHHCVHTECIQNELNLGWRKLERANMVVDEYGEQIIKFTTVRYLEAWTEAQATLSSPGKPLWWAAREKLSGVLQTSCTDTIKKIKSQLKTSRHILKHLGKGLAKLQKQLDGRPRNDHTGPSRCCGAPSVEPPQKYVTRYQPREFNVNPMSVYNSVFSATHLPQPKMTRACSTG